MVSTLPAAVMPTRCRIISWGYFIWLSGASRFQTLPSFPVNGCFFDDCRCFRHHQVLEGDWPDHAADYVPRPCTLPMLLSLPLLLFFLCFPRSSLLLLSGQSSVWRGCITCIVVVWFFRMVSETWSSNYFRINIRTGNIVIIVVNVRFIVVWCFTVVLSYHL